MIIVFKDPTMTGYGLNASEGEKKIQKWLDLHDIDILIFISPLSI
jgi:hypothetical protein